VIELDGKSLALGRWGALVAALVIAGLGTLMAIAVVWHDPWVVTDIDQVWFAARALLDGRNPYDLIGPGREFEWPWQFYYPLPAAVMFTPLAAFPVEATRLFMSAVASGVLAWFLARHDVRWLVVFLSRVFMLNMWYSQWGMLLTCALFLPVLGAFFPAKPQIGVAMAAGLRDWRAVRIALLAALVPMVLSFILQPGWVTSWLATLPSGTHLRPVISFPGGFILLLAVLRWRRWEGRLLAVLAVVPQTVTVAGAAALLLTAKSFRALLVFSMLTYLPYFAVNFVPPIRERVLDAGVFVSATTAVGVTTLIGAYLPALWNVLRLRNEGPAPSWVERVVARWPHWLRGQPHSRPHAAPISL
jgi:hypothetical protein